MPPPRRPSFQANAIFVDRAPPKRIFEAAALGIPAEGCLIRVWYGVGGQGKTALARELFRMSDGAVDPSYRHLRRAILDLHQRPKTDPDKLMVWCRNALARAGVGFPAFDLAFAIMWERTRGDETLPKFENPWLQRTGEVVAEAAPDLVQVTRELVEDFVETIPALGLLLRRGASWSFEHAKRAWLQRTRPQLSELYRDGRLIEDHEMSTLMPWMLAQDLNRHLADHPDERFVLFVDEYERVIEGAGTGAQWRENPFDTRMRELVAETDGLLACFFTRERLHWEEDPDWRALLDGQQHLLGGLDARDAESWLLEVPVEDAELRNAMIEGARETKAVDAPVYPLMLDLLVAHWRNLGEAATRDDFQVDSETFEGRRHELVHRLLRDYGDPVQAVLQRLALGQCFDRAAFEHVVNTFNIPLAFDMFDRLADLSILSEGEDGWLTPHRAVADAIVHETDDKAQAATRACLIEHFAARARSVLPKDVTEEHLTCLREAARLRLGQGVEGYVPWLKTVGDTISIARRAAFLEVLWREALEAVQATLGEAHPDTGASFNNVARNLDDQGRHEEAEPLLRKGLAISRATRGEADSGTGASYSNLAYNLDAQGRYAEAEPLHRKGLEIRRAALGEAHPETGQSFNNVASNLQYQGRFAEAEPLYRNGLKITRTALGETHAATGASYNGVAYNLQSQGRFAEAEPLYRKALEIRRAALGEAHPETGASFNNVAGIIQAQGHFAEAESLYRKGLEIRRVALGEAHPETGASFNNLAGIIQAQGRFREAEPLYRMALAINQAALGEAHANTGKFYGNVASNLQAQGRYEEAEPLHRKALAITQAALGEAHPETGASFNNLAGIIQAQGRFAEAEQFYRQSLEIGRAALGEAHPETGAMYSNLAVNLFHQGRHEEAEPLCRRALEILRTALGKAHSETATTYNDLAAIIDAKGRYAEAELFYRTALDIRRSVLGEEHVDTAASYNNLGSFLDDHGRYAEAEPLLRKGLKIRRAALGEAHPHTGLSYNNYAANINAQGRPAEAAPLLRKGLEILRAALGEAHPDTGFVYSNLARSLQSEGRYSEAEPLFERGLAILLAALPADHPHVVHCKNDLELCRTARRRDDG